VFSVGFNRVVAICASNINPLPDKDIIDLVRASSRLRAFKAPGSAALLLTPRLPGNCNN
jgi:hypothetical protein